MDLKLIAKNVFKIEAEEVLNIAKFIDNTFELAITAILNSSGKVIISGMGKSGIIGHKISATLSSTGTPSFFIHPGEAFHGDLGMIEPNDVIILISFSGETDEVLKLLPFFKSQNNTLISITGNPNSTLAINTDYHLNVAITQEACPLQLAPTSSTTATLVMGDALAVALMYMRNFKAQDFAKFHPGGTLGRRLITTVESVMKKDELPTCAENTNMKDIINIITHGKCGLVVVLRDKYICGIITDGDLRRAMSAPEESFFKLQASAMMTKNPKCITKDAKLTDAGDLMNTYKINSLVVAELDNTLAGIIQMYDLGI